LLLTIAIAALVPAADAYLYHQAAHPALVDELPISDHLGLRDGTLREIDLRHLQGLVTFPSFHVILAALFVYALRGIGWACPAAFVFNVAVVVSTLPAGGHYMIDAPGGLAVTFIAVAFQRMMRQRLAVAAASSARRWPMPRALAAALADRVGATAIEYGLIACLIMVAILVAVTATGTQLNTLFNNVANVLLNSPAG
jgi:Flp pilus assembly pilin Flp